MNVYEIKYFNLFSCNPTGCVLYMKTYVLTYNGEVALISGREQGQKNGARGTTTTTITTTTTTITTTTTTSTTTYYSLLIVVFVSGYFIL